MLFLKNCLAVALKLGEEGRETKPGTTALSKIKTGLPKLEIFALFVSTFAPV